MKSIAHGFLLNDAACSPHKISQPGLLKEGVSHSIVHTLYCEITFLKVRTMHEVSLLPTTVTCTKQAMIVLHNDLYS